MLATPLKNLILQFTFLIILLTIDVAERSASNIEPRFPTDD
jgi:hypothetical protein